MPPGCIAMFDKLMLKLKQVDATMMIISLWKLIVISWVQLETTCHLDLCVKHFSSESIFKMPITMIFYIVIQAGTTCGFSSLRNIFDNFALKASMFRCQINWTFERANQGIWKHASENFSGAQNLILVQLTLIIGGGLFRTFQLGLNSAKCFVSKWYILNINYIQIICITYMNSFFFWKSFAWQLGRSLGSPYFC